MFYESLKKQFNLKLMLRYAVKITLNYDGVVLEICLDHKSQCTQEGLNCESLAYKVLTNPLGHEAL